jgi:hypothetical protein
MVDEADEDPLRELEDFVVELCELDWAAFVARDWYSEQREEHAALVVRMAELFARLEARDDAMELAARLEARVEGWWKWLQHGTRECSFAPDVHPWHWRTRLQDGARSMRYAAAKRSMPDACGCRLAEAFGLPSRPPPRAELEVIATGDDPDLPYPAPWTEYRCRRCGAGWREDDASSENWTASSWARTKG